MISRTLKTPVSLATHVRLIFVAFVICTFSGFLLDGLPKRASLDFARSVLDFLSSVCGQACGFLCLLAIPNSIVHLAKVHRQELPKREIVLGVCALLLGLTPILIVLAMTTLYLWMDYPFL